MQTMQDNLRRLGIDLTPLQPPVAAFQLFVQTGNLVHISGHIAKRNGEPWAGKLGDRVTLAEGIAASRSVAINLVNTLNAAVGDLERVVRIVKLCVLVNSSPDFTEQHLVANGASELFVELFGAKGSHARTSFGVAQLPFGACVEIDLIAEVSDVETGRSSS